MVFRLLEMAGFVSESIKKLTGCNAGFVSESIKELTGCNAGFVRESIKELTGSDCWHCPSYRYL